MERGEPSPGLPSGRRLVSETLAAKWVELVSQALLLLLVPRALGPPAYGDFAVAFGVVSLCSLSLGMGAPLAAIRYLPSSRPPERLARARTLATSVATTRARMLAVLTAAAIVLAPTLLDVGVGLTVLVCAAAWCSVGSSICSELALALGRTRVWNARFPLENGLIVVAAPAGHAALGGHGAIAGMALACAVAFAALFLRVTGELREAPPGTPLPQGAATYARFQTASVILGTLVTRGGPLAMPFAGASSTEIGFAAIATGVGSAGAATMISLLLVQLPRLVRYAVRAPEDAEQRAWRVAQVALLLSTTVAILVALLAAPIIALTLGPEFTEVRSSVVLALLSLPLGAAIGLASLLASLRLRPGALTFAWAAGLTAFAVLAAATMPVLGADGAALAMSCGLLFTCLTATALLGGRRLRTACVAAVAGALVVLAAGELAA